MMTINEIKIHKDDDTKEDTKGEFRSEWTKLTNDEIDPIKNTLELLKTQLEKTYGASKTFARDRYNKLIDVISTEIQVKKPSPKENSKTHS
jgi:hypothetical protein